MENIYSMTVSKLNDYFLSINEKKYRTEQLYDWLYVKRINDFSSITNMKKEIIEKLKQDFYFDKMEIIEKQSDVDVKKYLLKLSDNNTIEAVLMKHDYGNSLCISSEVGCNMACSFCESGRIKKIRNVTSGEMVLEILKIESDTNTRISHAKELSNLLKGINCYVNLIPYNETNHLEYKRSDKASILAFYDTLKKNNINVTIRREFGGNIKAACGQLKSIKENLA